MENPIKEARNQHGWTQAQLAKASKVTPLSILRHEQATLSLPSGKIAIALNLSYPKLEREYKRFQTQQREQVGRYYRHIWGGRLQTLESSVGSFSEFRHLVLDIPSQAEFCTSFCVHQASIFAYEKAEIKNLPAQLRRALTEADCVSYTVLDELTQIGARNFNARKQNAESSGLYRTVLV
jgi:DNA-binding XRE family transcriptional regulator